MKRTLLSISFLLALCSAASAAPTSAESLRNTYDGLHRVISIAQNIFRTNLTHCKNERRYFGFSYIALSRNATSEDRALWADALNAKEVPSVIFVFPKGAADRAGLRVGDLVVSVNGKPWPEATAEQDEFVKSLSNLMRSQSSLQLIVRRNGEDMPALITADKSCDIDVNFVPNNETNAFAGNNLISFESGLVTLLETDSEIAFLVAHELAHIFLGHVPLTTATDRASIERAADELGIQIMMRAGYDPEGSVTAIRKLDRANRGPISRMLGLFGDYMPTEKRVEFLRNVAAKAADFE